MIRLTAPPGSPAVRLTVPLSGIPNPTVPPTVALVRLPDESRVPQVEPRVVYTYLDGIGESLPSPPSDLLTVAGGDYISASAPPLPPHVIGLRWYLEFDFKPDAIIFGPQPHNLFTSFNEVTPIGTQALYSYSGGAGLQANPFGGPGYFAQADPLFAFPPGSAMDIDFDAPVWLQSPFDLGMNAFWATGYGTSFACRVSLDGQEVIAFGRTTTYLPFTSDTSDTVWGNETATLPALSVGPHRIHVAVESDQPADDPRLNPIPFWVWYVSMNFSIPLFGTVGDSAGPDILIDHTYQFVPPYGLGEHPPTVSTCGLHGQRTVLALPGL